jgi:NADH:ubiquinone oxidoreductase subunit E
MEVSMAIKPEVRKGVEAICAEYSKEPSPLMMILSKIQKEYGYIPLEVQEIVSAKTGIPVAEIYGVVTFYSFFSLEPKGKYVLGICLGTACYVKSSQQILDKFEQLLGIKAGQTTPDGLFTIEAIRCMGACALAPAMSVNGKVYPKVTPDEVDKILAEYKAMEANA